MGEISFRSLQILNTIVGPIQSRTTETPRISERVLDVAVDAEGTDPREFNRLYDVIDPDVLDGLLQSAKRGDHVEFPYLGYGVTVCPDGDINLGPPDA